MKRYLVVLCMICLIFTLTACGRESEVPEVELLPAADAPILAFLRGEEPAEAGMACAKALTRMMVGAYGK